MLIKILLKDSRLTNDERRIIEQYDKLPNLNKTQMNKLEKINIDSDKRSKFQFIDTADELSKKVKSRKMDHSLS
jgi:hypothetical protein